MRLALAASLLALSTAAFAQETEEPPTPASVIAASKTEEWKAVDPADLLVMDLAPDAAGEKRRVVVQLVPPPFSEGWVANLRKLAQAHWWDGTSVYRVVDNWVAQWGDVDETKQLPDGVGEQPDDAYSVPAPTQVTASGAPLCFQAEPGAQSPQVCKGMLVFRGPRSAEYAAYWQGFPFAGSMSPHRSIAWPTHCYGSVGVARSVGSGGTGSELYAVIGHAPRQLDRNIAVVGRVIEGIEHLSTLPRGTGEAGVYETVGERVPIVSVRLSSEFPDAPRFEYLDSESESFAAYVHIRANRHDSFYLHPAGGIDVCNVQPPVRRVSGE